jgi:hypothetical protein
MMLHMKQLLLKRSKQRSLKRGQRILDETGELRSSHDNDMPPSFLLDGRVYVGTRYPRLQENAFELIREMVIPARTPFLVLIYVTLPLIHRTACSLTRGSNASCSRFSEPAAQIFGQAGLSVKGFYLPFPQQQP